MGHPFFFDMAHARLEFEVTCFSAVQELLTRTGISPKQVRGGRGSWKEALWPPQAAAGSAALMAAAAEEQ
jgi:hypothetical protein